MENDLVVESREVEMVENDLVVESREVEMVENDPVMESLEVEMVENDLDVESREVEMVENDLGMESREVEMVENDERDLIMESPEVEMMENDENDLIVESPDIEMKRSEDILVVEIAGDDASNLKVMTRMSRLQLSHLRVIFDVNVFVPCNVSNCRHPSFHLHLRTKSGHPLIWHVHNVKSMTMSQCALFNLYHHSRSPQSRKTKKKKSTLT